MMAMIARGIRKLRYVHWTSETNSIDWECGGGVGWSRARSIEDEDMKIYVYVLMLSHMLRTRAKEDAGFSVLKFTKTYTNTFSA